MVPYTYAKVIHRVGSNSTLKINSIYRLGNFREIVGEIYLVIIISSETGACRKQYVEATRGQEAAGISEEVCIAPLY